jgi:hypothetical protein
MPDIPIFWYQSFQCFQGRNITVLRVAALQTNPARREQWQSGGIPRYFTRDWRRIEEDKSRAPRPIIK